MFLYLIEYFAIASAPLFALTEGAVTAAYGSGYWSQVLGLTRSWDIVLFTILVFSVVSPLGSIALVMRAKLKPDTNVFRELLLHLTCARGRGSRGRVGALSAWRHPAVHLNP